MAEIGIAFQTDKPPGRYGELAAAAEAHGFNVVSVFADLLDQPPLPALLEMARATSRVRLGAACLNPYTQHPYEIAGGLAALDAASGGRAYLGLARGAWLRGDRHRAAPPAGPPARHRGDRARAAVRRRARLRRRRVPAGARGPAAVPGSGACAAVSAGCLGAARGRAGRRDRRRGQGGRERQPGGGAADPGPDCGRCSGRGPLPGPVRVVLGAVTVVDRDGPRPADGPAPRWPGTWRSWRTSTRLPNCLTGSPAGSGTWSRPGRTRPPAR